MGFLLEKCKLVKLDDKIYQKNEFLFLFSTEQQEAENLGYDVAKTLHTRLMYYDLKKCKHPTPILAV